MASVPRLRTRRDINYASNSSMRSKTKPTDSCSSRPRRTRTNRRPRGQGDIGTSPLTSGQRHHGSCRSETNRTNRKHHSRKIDRGITEGVGPTDGLSYRTRRGRGVGNAELVVFFAVVGVLEFTVQFRKDFSRLGFVGYLDCSFAVTTTRNKQRTFVGVVCSDGFSCTVKFNFA